MNEEGANQRNLLKSIRFMRALKAMPPRGHRAKNGCGKANAFPSDASDYGLATWV